MDARHRFALERSVLDMRRRCIDAVAAKSPHTQEHVEFVSDAMHRIREIQVDDILAAAERHVAAPFCSGPAME